ncbi:AzlC family ABC transporter permease [Antrihabitans sp. YC3-6]|uniref:AzlC family ABC transporter permease n=1 Tax=Antrihabitans stalagmiti TaxID=2799499 RepID=A0A934NMK5_9NOCA|nr:AzlC family ABC transporter permease [Antrihabitans stalagmiti]MBJ8337915.1 AzlC family ABC transporter permease [Antrihabitans stalagmiti]
MRSIWRTLDRSQARDVGLVCLADGIVGISFGAIAVGAGFPIWLPMLLSVIVFAGAAQFMFIGIVAAGGNPIAAVAAGILVNARHLPFGFAIGDVIGDRWSEKVIGAHLMIDESVAFTLAQRDRAKRRATYWLTGIGLFICWNLGVVVGAIGGSAVGDTDAFGLDAAFPAVLLALILPSLRDPATRRAGLAGGVIALATTPFLPAGVPVLLALAGVLVGYSTQRKTVS